MIFRGASRALFVAVAIGFAVGSAGPGAGAERVVQVPAGGDLQAAIDAAEPGTTIALTPGATYEGNFVLRAKPGQSGETSVVIRTAAGHSGLPAADERITPGHAPLLAKLKSPNRQPVLRTDAGARGWRLELLEIPPTEDGFGDVIMLGTGASSQNSLDKVPSDLVLDRIYLYGHPERGQKRGVALNSGRTAIINSHISGIRATGQDSQAIAGWNGPGPYRIENNYLEAASENFLLGGGDPRIEGLVTEDVVFRRNHLAKPVDWKGAGRWVVKNLFQLKNARKVLVEENLMEYTWRDGQVGYAIVLSPRNQDGGAPWATVQDVTIRRNVIRHAGGGMQIIGQDSNHPSGPTKGIRVEDNLFYDIDGKQWGGTGAFLLIGDGPAGVVIERNTVSQSGNIVMAYGGRKGQPARAEGFVFRGNAIRHNNYGVHGADRAPGRDSLDAFFPGAVFTGNVIAGGRASLYPDGNRFLPADAFSRLFIAPEKGDFRPAPGGALTSTGGPGAGASIEPLATLIASIARDK
jgi:hypothetical protein